MQLRAFILFLLCWSCHAQAESPNYLSELQLRAEQAELSRDPQWRAFLHYTTGWFGAGHSLADEPGFFLSPEGRGDPRAELAATLAAFFEPADKKIREQHPQCAFIARYRWLKDRLGFDLRRLPEQKCEGFRAWREFIDPGGLTLIFSSAYLNNPASMFGHTFIRIDGKSGALTKPLLGAAANYAAQLEGDPGLVFALKGVFGGYHGYFSVAPYIERVKKYNDFENRDIWEYRLNFDQAQVERVVEHLWELQQINFTYYYFDNNCSYHLLGILDVADPSLGLLSKFQGWVIPTETLRGALADPSLVRDVAYRPSPATLLRAHERELSDDEVRIASQLAHGELAVDNSAVASRSEESRAHIFELAGELLEYQRIRRKVPREEAAPRTRALLSARSALHAPPLVRTLPPPRVSPDRAHSSWRAAVIGGVSGGKGFTGIELRPAYHDIYDSSDGYVNGASLLMGKTELRLTESEGIELERLALIDVASLSPQDRLLKPLSWHFGLDAEREFAKTSERVLTERASIGFGVTREIDPRSFAYLLAAGAVKYNSHYDDNWTTGIGPQIGFVTDLGERWRLVSEGTWQRFGFTSIHTQAKAGAEVRYALGDEINLGAGFSWNEQYNRSYTELIGRVAWYF